MLTPRQRSSTTFGRAAAFVVVVLGVLLCAVPAFAAKAIALYVEGPNSSEVRKQMLESVPKGVDVVDPDTFSSALVRAGQKGPIGNTIAVAKLRDKQLKTLRKAAELSKAEAVIVGRVRKTKTGGDEVYIVFVDAAPGDLEVDEAVPLKGSPSERSTAIKSVLGPHLEKLAPTEAATPDKEKKPDETKPDEEAKAKPDDGKDKADEPASDRKANNVGTAIFVVGANVEFGGRRFKYTDNAVNTQNLRPYDVYGTPLLAFDAEIYPAATTGITGAKDIGLVGAYAQAFGLSSEADNGTKSFKTTWRRWYAGLRYRLRAGDSPTAPVIGLSMRFGMTTFKFEPDDPASKAITGELPSVNYTYIRPGIDGRIPIGPVAIMAGFGYDAVLNAGNVYDRFTDAHKSLGGPTKGDASIGAIDADLGLAVAIIAGLEGRIVAEYSRYFYKFSPEVGDDYVAGGALDELLGLRVGIAYAY